MKNRTPDYPLTIFTLFSLSILIFSCNPRSDEDSFKSSMFMRDIQHSGSYESDPVKTEPSLLWKVKTQGQVISSPVIVDNILYIGSVDHKLYAIDASSGETEWVFKTQGPIHSTPAVSKGMILFLSYDGYFYALNQSDGKLAWKYKTGGEEKYQVKDYYNKAFAPDFWDFYLSSAIVNDNLVYFGSSDSHVYALDLETGEKVWQYKTGGSIHSSPALYDNSLIIGSWDSNTYCLDALTGKENWIYETGKDTAQYIWIGIQASPSIDEGIAYVGSRDAKLYAFDIATKTNAYTFSSPAIDKEMGYIGSANGRLYGIELDTGEKKWEFQTVGSKTDNIRMFDSNGILDLTVTKELTKDISNMPDLSSLYTDIYIHVGAILSSPVISGQTIYFGSSDGYIYAITDKE